MFKKKYIIILLICVFAILDSFAAKKELALSQTSLIGRWVADSIVSQNEKVVVLYHFTDSTNLSIIIYDENYLNNTGYCLSRNKIKCSYRLVDSICSINLEENPIETKILKFQYYSASSKSELQNKMAEVAKIIEKKMQSMIDGYEGNVFRIYVTQSEESNVISFVMVDDNDATRLNMTKFIDEVIPTYFNRVRVVDKKKMSKVTTDLSFSDWINTIMRFKKLFALCVAVCILIIVTVIQQLIKLVKYIAKKIKQKKESQSSEYMIQHKKDIN